MVDRLDEGAAETSSEMAFSEASEGARASSSTAAVHQRGRSPNRSLHT